MAGKSSVTNDASLTCAIRYLTTSNCHVPYKSIAKFSYNEKESKKSGTQKPSSNLENAKKNFVTSRGESWFVSNKRPDYFREHLIELEKQLKISRIVATANNGTYFQSHMTGLDYPQRNSIFSNGCLASFLVNKSNIEKLVVDPTLVKTVTQEFGNVSSGVICKDFIILSSDNKNNLFFVTFNPNKSQVKLSAADYKTSYLAVPGPPSNRKIARNICVNSSQNLAICWCASHRSATGWTPTVSEYERANLVLLACDHGRLDILHFITTEFDPAFVQFGVENENQIFTVEKCTANRSSPAVNFTVYEYTKNKIQRIEVNQITTKSGALSCALNSSEDKIVIGCSDGSLILYDLVSKVKSVVHDSLIPTMVKWHPHGGAIVVCSGVGDLRCYDNALNKLSCVYLDGNDAEPTTELLELSKHLASGNGLDRIWWLNENGTSMFLVFDSGPCAVLTLHLGTYEGTQLRPLDVIQEYVKSMQIEKAIQVLASMNWNTNSTESFAALTMIFNKLMKQRLNLKHEEHLEAVLGTFYVPKYTIADAVVIEYRTSISRYSRRFFFYLLRYFRFRKAFLLATDLQSHDLFIDLYFAARKAGEVETARSAKRKAIELADSDTSDFDDSSDLSSEYEDEILEPMERISPKKQPEVNKVGKQTQINYPALKVDNFMFSLMKEAEAVAALDSGSEKENVDIDDTTSTLKVLHLGYV